MNKSQSSSQPTCNYCKESGHIKTKCPRLTAKKERENRQLQEEENKKKKFEFDFPPLSTMVIPKNLTPLRFKDTVVDSLTDKEKMKINSEYADKLEKQKKEKPRIDHFEYLERNRIREEKIERKKKEKEEQKMKFIQKMNDAYGIRWFLFMKPEDTDEKEFNLLNKDEILFMQYEFTEEYEDQNRIREEEAEAEYDRLERESDEMFTRIEENRNANIDKMKSSMCPEEFVRWYNEYRFECEMEDMDMIDDYCNECFYEQSYSLSRYATHAPPRYVEYAYQTGILKDYKDKSLERADREMDVSEI